MANHNKNTKARTQDWVEVSDAFDQLPEIEKIRYARKRRKGEIRNSYHKQRSNKH